MMSSAFFVLISLGINSLFAGVSNDLTVPCDGTTLSRYVDSVLRDSNDCNQWRPANNFWQIGQANLNATFLGGWVWNRALSSAEVWILAYLFQHGLSPSSGSLLNGAVQHWTFNCDSSHCPISISGAPAAIFDSTPPTVAITAPSNGATSLSGSVTVTATCTDRVAATSVQLVIDNAVVATQTAGPFTTTWDTTKVVDGSHVIYAVCTNISGLISTSPTSTVSTSNGVSAKTVYLDSTSGTDCPTNTGLSSSSPCSTFAGVKSVINSNPLHGGDSILLKAGTNININDLNTSSVLQLCGPSASSTFCGSIQNVYPGKTITIGTYGGSGNCNILSGITTDCASITLASNTGKVPRDGAALIAINVPNLVVQNLRVFGSQSNALVCPPNQSTGCSEGIKYGTANGYFNGSSTSTTTFQNIEITDFFIQLYISNATSPGYLTYGYLCGVTVRSNYMHGSTVSTAVSSGIQVSDANCNLGASGPTAATVTGNYTKNQGGIGGEAVGSGIIMNHQNVNVVDKGGYGPAQSCRTITYQSDDWYPLAGQPFYQAAVGRGNITGVSNWNAASGDTGIQINPNFASRGGGAGVTCYSGSGVPTAPTCVTNYKLQTGSSLIGPGLNLTEAPYDLTLPTTDFFNVAIPNSVGTGYNLGADGAYH